MEWLLAGSVVLVVLIVLVVAYLGLVTAAVPIDLGLGRRVRPLGPQTVVVAAPREVVFDVVAAPYLGRQTRAVAEKIRILERGTDMVLAAHRTPVHRWLGIGGWLVATTVETVRFSRPDRVDFRLVRGPVPHVVEWFALVDDNPGTQLTHHGELGTDLWALGAWWGKVVGRAWERTVAASLETIKTEAERRHRARS
jgi:hypothetical protein